MVDLAAGSFHGRDGVRLAYRELGHGKPLLLLHGYISNASENWVRYGHAGLLADRGHRVIMPDLRAHGDSSRPHEAGAYPPDVLADDAFALVEHLGLAAYDLGGYSLGGRTAVRMLARGAGPDRAVVAGTGLEPILDARRSGDGFREVFANPGTFRRGTAQWRAEAFLTTMRGDPVALRHILDTLVDTPREAVERIRVPTLVLMGEEDGDHGDGAALASLLPHGRHATIPGNHMSAVAKPDLGIAVADFL